MGEGDADPTHRIRRITIDLNEHHQANPVAAQPETADNDTGEAPTHVPVDGDTETSRDEGEKQTQVPENGGTEPNRDEREAEANVPGNGDRETREDQPKPNLSFDSGAEFASYCHRYAYSKGFTFFSRTTKLKQHYKDIGVRRVGAGSAEPLYHMMQRIRLHCKYGGAKTSEGSTVTGCPVYVDARIVGDRMTIRNCVLEHNHALHPKTSRLVVQYRSIDDPTFEQIKINDSAGIPINKSFNALLVENGDHESITYNRKDVRNAVNLERRRSRFQGDAVALENYFEKQYQFNDRFFSAIERDTEGRLMNAFWSDARSRESFKDFGDIVTFDTTFSSNR